MNRPLAAGFLALCTIAGAAQPPHAKGRAVLVEIADLQFGPVQEGVRVGDVIEWVNKDFVDHTATARDDSFDVVIPASKSARIVLNKAGNVAFYCRYHPNMTGKMPVAP